MHRHCALTHAHRTGFPVKFLQPYGTLVPVTIFAHQAKESTENLDEVVWRSYISSHVQFQH